MDKLIIILVVAVFFIGLCIIICYFYCTDKKGGVGELCSPNIVLHTRLRNEDRVSHSRSNSPYSDYKRRKSSSNNVTSPARAALNSSSNGGILSDDSLYPPKPPPVGFGYPLESDMHEIPLPPANNSHIPSAPEDTSSFQTSLPYPTTTTPPYPITDSPLHPTASSTQYSVTNNPPYPTNNSPYPPANDVCLLDNGVPLKPTSDLFVNSPSLSNVNPFSLAAVSTNNASVPTTESFSSIYSPSHATINKSPASPNQEFNKPLPKINVTLPESVVRINEGVSDSVHLHLDRNRVSYSAVFRPSPQQKLQNQNLHRASPPSYKEATRGSSMPHPPRSGGEFSEYQSYKR